MSTTITVVSGNNQTVSLAQNLSGTPTAKFAPITVKVTANGAPVANQQVTWSSARSVNMAVQMEPSSADTATTTTGADGTTTLDHMEGSAFWVYFAQGGFTVTAACAGASVTMNQTVGGLAAPALHLAITEGNNQRAFRTGTEVPGGTALFAAMQVRLTNGAGQPIAGQRVNFITHPSSPGMAVQNDPGYFLTDGNGYATSNSMDNGAGVKCYYAEGPFTITVNTDNAQSVTFNGTVTPTPQSVTIQSGNGQLRAPINSAAVFAPLSVQVKGSSGAPLAGLPVTWSITSQASGMTLQIDPAHSNPCTSMTDGNGIATLNKMGGNSIQLQGGQGNIYVAATCGPASASFHLIAGLPLRGR